MDFSPRPRPHWIAAASAASLLAVAIVAWLRLKTADKLWRRRALASAIFFSTLIANPLSWSHYYLIVVVFAPVLIDLWGWRRGLLLASVVLVLTNTPLYLFTLLSAQTPDISVYLTLAGAIVATAAAPASPQTKPDRDLPPAPADF